MGLHFGQPLWLIALIAIPLVWVLGKRRWGHDGDARYRNYADPHLLPHLLVRAGPSDAPTARRRLRLWMWAWLLLVLAQAGPRWDYHDVELFRPANDLVILLDISRSMDVADVQPSRLARARQEIEDMLAVNPGMRVGIVAFASVAHVVAPLTDDMQTLKHVLPSLSTELVQLPGSRPGMAIERGRRLLMGQSFPVNNRRAILLISDGDFPEDTDLGEQVAELKQERIRFHVLGVGTEGGGPVPAPKGGWLQDSKGMRVLSPLEEDSLRELAAAGRGLYRRANFRDDDTTALLSEILGRRPEKGEKEGKFRIWNERFYLLVMVVLVLVLPWFRRLRGAASRVEGA
jgi:Ca-activated chloride channel family protein